MNRVELTGRLVRPPELSYTGGGTALLSFTIVVDSEPRYDPTLKVSTSKGNFISVQLWGRAAEATAHMSLAKGEKLYVLGELDQSTWEKKDGTKESKTRVRAIFVQALEPLADEMGEDVVAEDQAPF